MAYRLIAELAVVVAERRQTALARAVFMRLAFMGRLGFSRLLRLATGYRLAFDNDFAVRCMSLAMIIAIAILHRIEYGLFTAVCFLTEIALLLEVAAVYRRREWMPSKAWARPVMQ